MRTLLIAMVGLVVAGAASATVTCIDDGVLYCVINNGLGPPEPENVIDDATYYDANVTVRNVGCPPGWPSGNPGDPCPSPGGPTEVEVVEGGGSEVHNLRVFESSSVAVSGGYIHFLEARDSAIVTMTGGAVGGALYLYDSSTVTMSGGTVPGLAGGYSSTVTLSGGTVQGALQAYDSVSFTIAGANFEVDAVPVPYGDLGAQTGTLTGTLASGDAINVVFYQGGYACYGNPCDGIITLAAEACGDNFIEGAEQCDDGNTNPGDGCDASCQIEEGWICVGEPSICTEPQLPTLSPWSQLALIAGLLGAGLGVWRGRGISSSAT